MKLDWSAEVRIAAASLAEPIRQLGNWAGAHIERIENNRSPFDAARPAA